MGTRSITVFKNNDNAEIVVLYRQYDGYISGAGLDLAKALTPEGKPCTLVNGYTLEPNVREFNGMGDLAVRVITLLKGADVVGGFYLYPAGTRDTGEEFTYIVYPEGKTVMVEVKNMSDNVFRGTALEFYDYCNNPEF